MAIKINQPIVDYKVTSKIDAPGPLFTLPEEHPVSQSDDDLVGIDDREIQRGPNARTR